ncbi:hypothetical protein [Croceimicrobium hydrocarbonivorans]|uniref:Uncharacterized protein n=1 Tax=Croceimicrobium hydrocarbonivorans TaxID=2761580 RepID=A0A7H0VGN8_9FLAO|nr:hypothetical protein [Croceimicrobium hydrocarbonivorans]QNR24886.1 hypothetical protein H4K34_03325 [Croceimicrobium hydrocarbonivorans]
MDLDTAKGPLGYLFKSDTLFLDAMFTECGEFGGNKEVIRVYPKNEILCATWSLDSADCDNEESPKYSRISLTTVQLSRSSENRIAEYIQEFVSVSFKYQYSDMHTGNLYSAYINSHPVYGEGIDFFASWYDESKSWEGFEKLRNEIITSANNGYSK